MYEEQIDRKTFTAVVRNPVLSAEELLVLILQEFGIVSRAAVARGNLADIGRQRLTDTLDAFVLSLRAVGARALVIVNGAQKLTPDVLQQIERLSNAETAEAKPLEILLVGSPAEAAHEPPRRPFGRMRPYLARIAAALLLAAVLGGSAAAVWHYREYATAFLQRVASRQ